MSTADDHAVMMEHCRQEMAEHHGQMPMMDGAGMGAARGTMMGA